MALIDPNRFNRPVVTGTPAAPAQSQHTTGTAQGSQQQFLSVLQQQLEAGSKTAFSKHAVSRVAERSIDVSHENLQRLSQGMQIAQEKGIKDALILIDSSAYIVSAANQKVITVEGDDLKGSAFTNIDGTVIV